MFNFKKLGAHRPCSMQRISGCRRVQLSAEFVARSFVIISK